MPTTSAISGLIIAGGLARRMGGVDKGLQLLGGRPLLAHVIERFAPQVDTLIINANHQPEDYAAFGCPLIADALTGYAGPLAGLQAGLLACTTPLLATVPCDSPFLPRDLVARLHEALTRTGAQLAVATAGSHRHHAFMLCRRELLPGLTAYLESGGRRIGLWYEGIDVVEVAFEDAEAFANINTLEELREYEIRETPENS